MRILLACEFYYPSVGGVQEVMRQLAERLVKRGHRVQVATTFLPERKNRILNGVEIVEFRVAGSIVNGLTGEVERYRTYVLDSEYDVLMIKAAQQWTFDALWPVLDRVSKPKVLIPCGFSCLYEPAYADYFHKLPAVLRKFDHLIFYASDYRDVNFARTHGISKFTIIPNGASESEFGAAIDRGFRRRHAIPENAFVLLTVGSLTGLKGHDELAEAFTLADFNGRAAVLILNGNRTRQPAWNRRLAQTAGTIADVYRSVGALRLARWIVRSVMVWARLGWLVEALGYKVDLSLSAKVEKFNRSSPDKRVMLIDLPRPELIQAYLNSDLFVFASNVEYSPLVLFEAAAAGLPFLSVPVGNAEEIAQWTGGGEICPAVKDTRGYTRVDTTVLAEQIVHLASDPARLSHLGTTGHRNWEDRFAWDKIVLLYEAVFQRCAQH